MQRKLSIAALALLAVGLVACGGTSDLSDNETPLYLTIDIEEYNPEVNIASSFDVTIAQMSIEAQPTAPDADITNQGVNLRRWVITPSRSDGGSTASPQWIIDQHVYVPPGGAADLANYRVFPAEYFHELPLSNLLPENGGFDPETGNSNIRQTLHIEIFGETVNGKTISVDANVAFNFFYAG